MATDVGLPSTNRPYPPPSTVTTVLRRLRSRNLPERIEAEHLRDAGVSDSLVTRTLFALRFLGLVSDDIPTAALRSIAASTNEEYQSILAGLLQDAYREVFEVVDPTQDSQDRILNVFRRYTPASQRSRMVVFFLGMCKEAGIPTLEPQRPRTGGSATNSKSSASVAKASHPAARATTRPATSAPKVEDSTRAASGLPAALELLMRSLPPEGTSMSSARREQWLSMARATLAFVYPDEADGTMADRQEEREEEL